VPTGLTSAAHRRYGFIGPCACAVYRDIQKGTLGFFVDREAG
jgi:hypothetical protein